MLNTPFSPWPSFSDEEARAAADVIASNRVNYWTGDEGRMFEKEFASWCGVDHAVALANGTIALEVALMALGIGEGDEVIVTPRTFIASVSCVVNAGAVPIFADVDRDSGNLTVDTIKAVVSERTRAIICVHLAGWPCDMDPIMEFAGNRGIKVVEDCAQAHGARYKGRSVGSIGDIGAWSFCQDKIISTGGEGGMVTTNNRSYWDKIWSYKDHGKSWEAVFEREHPPGFRWMYESFGSNGRMLEVQAVIGRIQLRRMEEWSAKRTRHAEAITAACRRHEVVRVPELRCDNEHSPGIRTESRRCSHAYYRMYAYVENSRLGEDWSRDRIIAEINDAGVPCYHGSCPEVYLEEAFADTGWRPMERLPVARELGETSLMFLVHPTLTHDEVERTCCVIDKVFHAAANLKPR